MPGDSCPTAYQLAHIACRNRTEYALRFRGQRARRKNRRPLLGGREFVAIIKRIKTLKGVGILADKGSKDQSPSFLRFNLLYGFNGSGKSTLSRVFACLEAGKQHEALPEECSFEIELDDGTSYTAPKKLTGSRTAFACSTPISSNATSNGTRAAPTPSSISVRS